jgi:hypothetical protein
MKAEGISCMQDRRNTPHSKRFANWRTNDLSRPPVTPHVSRFTSHASRFTAHGRPSQRGVALVITLILLAVITFMAITFLVVSRSEHGSVATQTDMAIAKLAADTARERAIAEALAPILANNNPFNCGLVVSTNFINTNGFTTGVSDPLNVNYDYTTTGTALSPADALLNMANLWYNPRPPVFIAVTNSLTNFIDSRYYLDLNRNGLFDHTGWLALTNAGRPIGTISYQVGDPQWIGMLQHPEFPHGADNFFTSRYAYMVVPVGQNLDLNTIHNYAKFPTRTGMSGPFDGFLRNQGVLPAEINFAAFLADLNTNLWPLQAAPPSSFGFSSTYNYAIDPLLPDMLGSPNTGQAFDNALGCLTYRYNNNYRYVADVARLFGKPGTIAFTNEIDAYSGGPLMNGTWWPPGTLANPNAQRIALNYPWPGTCGPNAFSSPQDLFDENKTAANYNPTARGPIYTLSKLLKMAGTNVDSYNRTTFYRLLSQLGTDASPETEDRSELGKMNLNYRNVDDRGYVVPEMVTNFLAWDAARFFTNAAIRLLVDAGYTVGAPASTTNLLSTNYVNGVLVTNLHIPIYPTNFYTPSVHRLLQLAANIYDSSTNRADLTDYPYLPTVFRPIFRETPNSSGHGPIYVVAYTELTAADLAPARNNRITGTIPPHDLSDPVEDYQNLGLVQPGDMVYNVPLVIGAKKGLPSFDEMAMQTQIQVARKLIYRRAGSSPDAPVNEIDPQYLITITNVVGVQTRNAYSINYPRNLQMQVWPDTSVLLTNVETRRPLNLGLARFPTTPTNYPLITTWPGYNNVTPQYSFITPLGSSEAAYVFMPTNTSYSFVGDRFIVNGTPDRTPGQTNWHVPQFEVTVKARLRFALIDTTANRLVDYVNLAANQVTNLAQILMVNPDGSTPCSPSYNATYSKGGMWCTNLASGYRADPTMPNGVRMQIDACKGSGSIASTVDWRDSLPDPIYGNDHNKAVSRFLAQFDLGGGDYPKVNTFGAPFQPFRNVYVVTLWQANDPLVHYTAGDLKNTTDLPRVWYLDTLPNTLPPTGYKTVNNRCAPWGGQVLGGSTSPTKFDWRIKDSVPRGAGISDDWDFPASKLPHPGWLGRVHRGTPWQTVYLKSAGVDYPTWIQWSGNDQWVTNYGQLDPNLPQFFWVYTTNKNSAGMTVVTTNQVAFDCTLATPTNDWRLMDLFTTAISPSATRGRLSVNQTNLAAWSAVLSGVIVLTNSVDSGRPTNLPMVVQPAGYYDPTNPVNMWPAVARIVRGINVARANTNNTAPIFTNQVFHRLGDLLSVPELTAGFVQGQLVSSPFLYVSPPNLTAAPIFPMPNDAALERLPQQILGLLQCDPTPRFAIYSYGQTLKPAVRSRVTSGGYLGLCTNYQITAEVATRTVVRFEGVPAYRAGTTPGIINLHPVIESFSVLPPD